MQGKQRAHMKEKGKKKAKKRGERRDEQTGHRASGEDEAFKRAMSSNLTLETIPHGAPFS